MTHLSVSNLAWKNEDTREVIPIIRDLGIKGIEIAPTLVWGDIFDIPLALVSEYAIFLESNGLKVSGVQSLLFGRNDLQVFNRETWGNLRKHLTRIVQIAALLECKVAVFGSPRNRIRGQIDTELADEIFKEFLYSLLPILEKNEVVLTIEPNAPEYGADYLTKYSEVVSLVNSFDSHWVQPQIDTGCMRMVKEKLDLAVELRVPKHVHISAPNLKPPPGDIDHKLFEKSLRDNYYKGWIVLEMLLDKSESLNNLTEYLNWFVQSYSIGLESHV